MKHTLSLVIEGRDKQSVLDWENDLDFLREQIENQVGENDIKVRFNYEQIEDD